MMFFDPSINSFSLLRSFLPLENLRFISFDPSLSARIMAFCMVSGSVGAPKFFS